MKGDPEVLSLHDSWPAALKQVAADPSRVRPAFQPIVDVQRGVVSGYEALARFESPISVSPAEWFTAAALYGYGPLLEATVLRSFIAARARLPANCFLSVNVSPGALVSDEVQECLAEQDDLRGLVLEITEQTPVEDYDRLGRSLDAWRARGTKIAVDDAGSGYASLRHILTIAPQFVKLDRALVEGLHEDTRKVAVVTAIGAFASSIDAWLVAEGVELQEELDALAALEVPLVQGFLLGRPEREMHPVPVDLSRHMRARSRSRDGGIGPLLEHAQAIGAGCEEGPGPPGSQLGVDSTKIVFRLDEFGRPTEMVLRDDAAAEPTVHAAMAVALDTPPWDLATRAMARPEADRLAPVACCDDEGRLLGLVRIERLVGAIARDLAELNRH